MDNLFNDIGLDNVDINTNEKSKFPSNDMILIEKKEEIEKETRYTEDGRPTDKYSIVVKTNYPNPDSTGNGVDTTPEIGSREDVPTYKMDGTFIETSRYSKSLMNQAYDVLAELRSRFKALMSYFYYENTGKLNEDFLDSIETIYKNLVNAEAFSRNNTTYNSKSKYSFYYFDNNLFRNAYLSYIKTLNEIDFSNVNISLSKEQDNSLFNNKCTIESVLSKLKIEEKNYVSIGTIFKSWDHIKDLIISLQLISTKLNDTNIEKCTYENSQIIWSSIKTMNEKQINNVTFITKRIYITAFILNELLSVIENSLVPFFKQITPKNQFSIYIDPTKVIYKVDKLNPWVSTDYHLLKELRKAEGTLEFTRGVLEMHNRIVKPTDLFLFLGDLSESEFFTEKDLEAQKKVIETCRLLHGRKIIITGNNDLCDDNFLKKCGFFEIYRDPVLLQKFALSHGPIITKPGIINVHGHIHGNKNYWIEHTDHIDAYYGLWGGPVKLNFLLNKKTIDLYQNGCKTNRDKLYQDPETLKVPGNLI